MSALLVAAVAAAAVLVSLALWLLLAASRRRLSDEFRVASADALRAASEDLLRLAEARLGGDVGRREEAIKGLVFPLREHLTKLESSVLAIEGKREKAYGGLDQQLQGLADAQARLQKETTTLSSALRNPRERGRWGEIHLKRVVELAGMIEHCDFSTQVALAGDDGTLRPDLVVRLPAGREIPVDAKSPLDAFLDHVAATTDEERSDTLARHARGVRHHVRALSSKGYWRQFERAPDFVVLYIPVEAAFSAALEADPALLEDALSDRVVIATPTTLVSVLRAVAMGWREEALAENAQQVSALGRDLYERLGTLAEHLAGVGKGLDRTVESYNRLVGSYDSRVLVAARRLKEYGAGTDGDLPQVEPVVKVTRVPREDGQGG